MQHEAARSRGTQTPHRPPVTNHTTMLSVINQNPRAAMRVPPRRARRCGARSYKQTSQSRCHGRWFQRGEHRRDSCCPPSFVGSTVGAFVIHSSAGLLSRVSVCYQSDQFHSRLVRIEQVITQCCHRSPVCLYVCCCCCADPCLSSPCF